MRPHASYLVRRLGGRVRAYHERVVALYESPRNVGSFDKTDHDVGTGLVGAPACGDVMRLQLRVRDGVVVDARFKTFGCGSAIASSSYATQAVMGLRLREAAALSNRDIAAFLRLPPVKLHCSMLAEDAIRAAIADYERKRETAGGGESASSVSPPDAAR